ncbi:universal stress protein PHOS34 [Cocos nucifera]|uniref:Universal stress protein PHOS34 n=1 Tax=Cocos nucifera TaxID=13894 RepID=A0A8K0NAZ3_COCNU|nr:universal stress protein PHOS34 [Cocos nucifera]
MAAAAAGNTVMVVGIDDSEHSLYALQWTLLHFFSGRGLDPPFKLVVVHAKRIATSVVGFAGSGAVDVLPFLELDLERIAARVMDKAKELCTANSVADVEYEVVEGDPRNVLCEAVEKHHADMLVVGSHGYGAIKRTVLGSVSDYCAHHAHCTVMIVKKPKPKH